MPSAGRHGGEGTVLSVTDLELSHYAVIALRSGQGPEEPGENPTPAAVSPSPFTCVAFLGYSSQFPTFSYVQRLIPGQLEKMRDLVPIGIIFYGKWPGLRSQLLN